MFSYSGDTDLCEAWSRRAALTMFLCGRLPGGSRRNALRDLTGKRAGEACRAGVRGIANACGH